MGTPASDWSDPAHPIAKHRQASKLGDADQPPPALTYPPKHPKPRAAALDDDDAWTHRGRRSRTAPSSSRGIGALRSALGREGKSSRRIADRIKCNIRGKKKIKGN
ncbi:hypothetical protein IMZ48_39585 [Candidatus Bathyarchaeota archaeon]|nr:hypothetical protein [Candidatus Bathyarchaeota archaeon]